MMRTYSMTRRPNFCSVETQNRAASAAERGFGIGLVELWHGKSHVSLFSYLFGVAHLLWLRFVIVC